MRNFTIPLLAVLCTGCALPAVEIHEASLEQDRMETGGGDDVFTDQKSKPDQIGGREAVFGLFHGHYGLCGKLGPIVLFQGKGHD